ncbi:tubulin-specific chaperone cofactor E-like protein [Actinia tenebrosa]|uniref:Tubulin-specific chaperone cofactor E-like protein n=1 Tax=Actinia tenebrosa TaxID=6105 RepID=A0A6P8HWS7_ACTTE|nr:tubulin-specific chaperone cofactor E-like protein [Actinia tenebrosa]
MEKQEYEEISLKEALLAKYNDDQFEVTNLAHISFSPKRKAALLKAMDYSKRTVIALDDCGVTCAGPPQEVAELCPNIEELDLGNNNITQWSEVFSIISQLKNLSILNLSGNPLTDDKTEIAHQAAELDLPSKPLPLKQLALNNTGISFDAVYALLDCFTSLEEIYLSLNEYSHIPSLDKQFPKVKRLYLNEHNLTEWTEVKNLGKMFPCMEHLIMTDSSLENILEDDAQNLFPALRVLSLNKTGICSWESIDALRRFPSLKDIRLLGIPLMDEITDDKEKRQHLIARLPNVVKINGTKVGTEEREDAERFFIRCYMDDQNPPKRLQELIEVYGVLDKLVDINLAPKIFAKLSIICEGHSTLTRDVDLRQTTKDFKSYISNELGIPKGKLALFFNDVESPFGMQEMNYVLRPLHGYTMHDGDEIHVFLKGL